VPVTDTRWSFGTARSPGTTMVTSCEASDRQEQGVGEEGVEPSRPYGHTDLNRARLPFRHSPEQRRKD